MIGTIEIQHVEDNLFKLCMSRIFLWVSVSHCLVFLVGAALKSYISSEYASKSSGVIFRFQK